MESLWTLFFNRERKFWGVSIAFENAFRVYLTFENTAPKGEQSTILVLLRSQGSGSCALSWSIFCVWLVTEASNFPTEAPTENRCMTVYDIESIFNNYFDTTFLLVWCFQSCLFQYLFWGPHAVFSQADTGASVLNWKVECPLHVLPFLCFTPYTHAHAYSVFTVDFWHVFLNSQKTSWRGCAIEHWLPSYR